MWCLAETEDEGYTNGVIGGNSYFRVDVLKKIGGRSILNNLVLIDIYDVAGREREDVKKKVNSKMLCEKIGLPNAKYIKTEEAVDYIKGSLTDNDILVIMGAGSIYDLQKEL